MVVLVGLPEDLILFWLAVQDGCIYEKDHIAVASQKNQSIKYRGLRNAREDSLHPESQTKNILM